MTYGQPYMGTDLGPKLLLDQGLTSSLSSLGWNVTLEDEVNPDVVPDHAQPTNGANAKNSERVGGGCKALAAVT